MIARCPTVTQAALQSEVSTKCGVRVSQPTISRWLKELHITRKRVCRRNREAQRPQVQRARIQFLERVRALDHDRILNLDECSWNLNSTPSHGYAPRGQRAIATRPAARGQRYSLILVIGSVGVVAWRLLPGSVTGNTFQHYLSDACLPRESSLVMDNASTHHASHSLRRCGLPTVAETLAGKHVEPLYLPPYSPELAPVELIFNTMRTRVHALMPRSRAALEAGSRGGCT